MSIYIIIAVVVVFWVICGVLAYGYTFAYFQTEYKLIAEESYKSDKSFALEAFFFGPISLLVCITRGDTKHGLKFK